MRWTDRKPSNVFDGYVILFGQNLNIWRKNDLWVDQDMSIYDPLQPNSIKTSISLKRGLRIVWPFHCQCMEIRLRGGEWTKHHSPLSTVYNRHCQNIIYNNFIHIIRPRAGKHNKEFRKARARLLYALKSIASAADVSMLLRVVID